MLEAKLLAASGRGQSTSRPDDSPSRKGRSYRDAYFWGDLEGQFGPTLGLLWIALKYTEMIIVNFMWIPPKKGYDEMIFRGSKQCLDHAEAGVLGRLKKKSVTGGILLHEPSVWINLGVPFFEHIPCEQQPKRAVHSSPGFAETLPPSMLAAMEMQLGAANSRDSVSISKLHWNRMKAWETNKQFETISRTNQKPIKPPRDLLHKQGRLWRVGLRWRFHLFGFFQPPSWENMAWRNYIIIYICPPRMLRCQTWVFSS